ncbi:MAG: metal ABC transporter permease [Candidatus Neomarinimicrobiota bacterium]|nr:MAG: metal ABC transporter permease [Candidatus Neomarinimicrobiota bacterium]
MAVDLIFWPFLAAVVISGIHVYLGLHVVTRGVIFVDLALAQVAALGTAVGVLWGLEPATTASYLLAFLFTLIGAGLFAVIRSLPRAIPQEAIIGITYVVAAALMVLLFSRSPEGGEELNHLLVGSILFVTPQTVGKMFLLYLGIAWFHWTFRSRFLEASRNLGAATSEEGHRHTRWDFLFYVTFGIVVTLSVRVAGVLLVFSYLIIPIVAALFFNRRPAALLIFGWSFGLVASVLGMVFSLTLDLPTGATIVVTFGLLLLLTAAVYLILPAVRNQRRSV